MSRFRALATGGLLAAALLFTAACGDDSDGGGTDSDSGMSNGEHLASLAQNLTVCDLVDVDVLVAALQSPGYLDNQKNDDGSPVVYPENIPPGVGLDPAGSQCSAQIKTPPTQYLESSAPVESGTTRFHSSVVGYLKDSGADQQYEDRSKEAHKARGAGDGDPRVLTELQGDWDRGVIVSQANPEFDVATNNGSQTAVTYAIVQKDSLILTIDVMAPRNTISASGKRDFVPLPYSTEDIKNAVTTMMTDFFANYEVKRKEYFGE